MLQKDLERARTLLGRLEAENHSLRKLRILSRDEVVTLSEGPLREDMVTLAEGEEDGDYPEPTRSTLSAIEQRIEKVFTETSQDGLDEDDLKVLKVRPMRSLRAPPATELYARLLYQLIWPWRSYAMPSIHATIAL